MKKVVVSTVLQRPFATWKTDSSEHAFQNLYEVKRITDIPDT